MKFIKWISISVISLIAIFYGAQNGYYFYLNSLPTESRYLIPKGYVGWIVIHYLLNDYPNIPKEDGVKIIKIPPSGVYKTSFSPMKDKTEGRYGIEYFFYSGNELSPIPNELIDWRGNEGKVDDNGQYYEFRTRLWIGTQEQYAKYGMKDYSNPRPGPIYPIDTKGSDNKIMEQMPKAEAF